jgi:hypothetical protein
MQTIDRRKLMVGGAVGATALAVASGSAFLKTEEQDQLLDLIQRYKDEVASWKTKRDISDEGLDADIDRADAILGEVEGLTAIGAAGALAALDLLRIDDIIAEPGINGRHFTPFDRRSQ